MCKWFLTYIDYQQALKISVHRISVSYTDSFEISVPYTDLSHRSFPQWCDAHERCEVKLTGLRD
jgi:hypothetical protein